MSSQVAGIAGADVFGAAPYANIINVKTHGIYGANAGGVSRGKSKSLHKSKSLQLFFKRLRTSNNGDVTCGRFSGSSRDVAIR